MKPNLDEAIGYRLAQDPPTVHEGVSDAAGLSQAQQEDLTCQEVLTWFRDNPSPACPPTLRPEREEGELKWYNNRFGRLRLVQFSDWTILLAILAETRQGEKVENEEEKKNMKKHR